MKCLGHVISADGVQTDPDKISAVSTWPRPQNVRELKSFLGFAGYYRRFIENYSRIAKPLNSLSQLYEPVRKRRGKARIRTKDSPAQRPSPDTPFGDSWTSVCQTAFDQLIKKLTMAPILNFANFEEPFVLHTDASTSGLGAALYQQHEGKLRPVAYASRGLSKSEVNYPAHKLEFLALKWAVTAKFSDYLYGNKFLVMTDNNPLTYVLSTAKLDAVGHRWLAALANYEFDLKYKPGRYIKDADGLSRRPHEPPAEDEEYRSFQSRTSEMRERLLGSPTQLSSTAEVNRLHCRSQMTLVRAEVVAALCTAQPSGRVIAGCRAGGVRPKGTVGPTESIEVLPLVETLTDSAGAIPKQFEDPSPQGQKALPGVAHEEWSKLQTDDPGIGPVLAAVAVGAKPSQEQVTSLGMETKLLVRQWDKLVIKNGVLYRRTHGPHGGKCNFQLVLPRSHREVALTGLHHDVGHPGLDRT